MKNGLPKGSVIASSFFNVYISDLPPTESLKLVYADDWTLATQSKTCSHLDSTQSRDIGHLNEYVDYWKLRLNANKTVATCFHLDNKQAARKLKVTLAGQARSKQYLIGPAITKLSAGDLTQIGIQALLLREQKLSSFYASFHIVCGVDVSYETLPVNPALCFIP